MKKMDLWLSEPVDFFGSNGNCYANVIHIDNTDNAGYIEDMGNEILFFNEMDEEMVKNVEKALEKLSDDGNERVVKFRALDSFTDKWCYGDLVHHPGCIEIVNGEPTHLVAPYSLGQFTGMTDDQGHEVYEGDVVNFVNHEGVLSVCTIEYYHGGFVAIDKETGDITSLLVKIVGNEVTIVGNIHGK